MSAQILDRHEIARGGCAETASRVAALVARSGIVPHLAVILVGDDPASRLYVANKVRCGNVGGDATITRPGQLQTRQTVSPA